MGALWAQILDRGSAKAIAPVLAIALANKLARIAWAVLNKERKFECIRTNKMAPRAA